MNEPKELGSENLSRSQADAIFYRFFLPTETAEVPEAHGSPTMIQAMNHLHDRRVVPLALPSFSFLL